MKTLGWRLFIGGRYTQPCGFVHRSRRAFYPLKALPNTWTRQGFSYQVLARCGMVVLVERLPCGIGAVPHFEVAHLTIHPERFVLGRRIRGGEAYPSAEQWGERGWTYQTLEAALAKFEALTVKVRTNKNLTP